MSDYLKNLQDSNALIHGFARDKKMPKEVSLLESELRDELVDVFTEDETDEALSEFDVGQGFGKTVIALSQGEAAGGGAVAAAALIALAVKVGNAIGTPSECKKYNGRAKNLCVMIRNNRKRISALKSKAVLCQKSKDPKLCSSKINVKMKELQAKVKSQEMQLKSV